MIPLQHLWRTVAQALPQTPKALLALVGMLGVGLLASPAAWAQDAAAATAAAPTSEPINWAQFYFIVVIALLLFVLVMVVMLMFLLDAVLTRETGTSPLRPYLKLLDLRNLWAVTPADKKAGADVELGHDYDGITELDNAAPPLFNYILYGTILFAVLYLGYYHVFQVGALQEKELEIALVEAEAEMLEYQKAHADMVTAKTVKLMTDASTLDAGKSIFENNCKACHGDKGQGLSGPNLTDKYWLHGGSINEVFNTISEGVPSKGMIAWKANLKPGEIAQVANFVISLQGTNPPGAKEPEGVEGGAPAATDSTAAKPDEKKISQAGK